MVARPFRREEMPAAQRTLAIDRSPDEVFTFFADPRNDQKWRPHVKEIAAEGPPRVGSTIHQVVAGPAGRGIPADIEVTAYEPPSRYCFRVIAGPARPVGEFSFTPQGSGTLATFSLTAQLRGIKKLLMAKAVQRSMDGEMAALDQAKALIEQA
jgi:uncharacterized protein YndB with AHSA1/START domain